MVCPCFGSNPGAVSRCFTLLTALELLPQVQKGFGKLADCCRTHAGQPEAGSLQGTFKGP